jgi:hypothetical protein
MPQPHRHRRQRECLRECRLVPFGSFSRRNSRDTAAEIIFVHRLLLGVSIVKTPLTVPPKAVRS